MTSTPDMIIIPFNSEDFLSDSDLLHVCTYSILQNDHSEIAEFVINALGSIDDYDLTASEIDLEEKRLNELIDRHYSNLETIVENYLLPYVDNPYNFELLEVRPGRCGTLLICRL